MDVVEISSPQKVTSLYPNKCAFSPYCFLYTSQGADMENLFNNQIRASLIGDHFLYSWLEHLTAIEQKIDF